MKKKVELKEWEKSMPIGVTNVLNECRKEPTSKIFAVLQKEDLDVVTPISEIRRIARSYSKRYHVPIKIDEGYMEKSHPDADAVHVYRKGKSTILLHPILQYYTPEYIKGVIEHELDHRKIELKWEKFL